MAEETALGTVGAADRTCQLSAKSSLQLVQFGLEVLLGDLASVAPITRLESANQDRLDRLRDLPAPTPSHLQHLPALPQQVREAGLVHGLLELAVGSPAVAGQQARVVLPISSAASSKPRPRLIAHTVTSSRVLPRSPAGPVPAGNLARAIALQNIAVVHRLSDLEAAGGRDSEQVRLACGLLSDSETKLIFRSRRPSWGRCGSCASAPSGRRGSWPGCRWAARSGFQVEHYLSG
jgi:hypothetical protein